MRSVEHATITLHPACGLAVVYGHKLVECRAWPIKYRGRLAIHAGRGNPVEGEWAWAELTRLGVKVPDEEPRSVMVGTVELVDCVRKGSGELWPDERLTHPLASGPVCWLLECEQPLDEPVPMPGQQGIWRRRCDRAVRLSTLTRPLSTPTLLACASVSLRRAGVSRTTVVTGHAPIQLPFQNGGSPAPVHGFVRRCLTPLPTLRTLATARDAIRIRVLPALLPPEISRFAIVFLNDDRVQHRM